MNKKALFAYEKGLFLIKKDLFTKKKKKDLITEKTGLLSYTKETQGKQPRQIATANSCGKLPRQKVTTNNHYKYMQRSANNITLNTSYNKKKFHVLF